jgi:pyruvate dehydrogenase E2 component (dihydrolipoyllysine-residue acetyltransferase)
MPVDVLIPPLSATSDTLVLVEWYRQEGEAVTKDEPLFAVETDKATLDVEAPASGILRHVSAQPGAEVAALSRIAIIAAPDEIQGDEVVMGEGMAGKASDPPAPAHPFTHGRFAAPPVRPLAPPIAARGERLYISPRARRLAESRGVAWRVLRGTGPEGAIVERDVRASLREGPAGDEAGRELLETIKVAGARAVIAARMLQSATTTAPVTLTTETDATELVALRNRQRAACVSCSYNDLLLWLLGRALREHPRLNASLHGDEIRVWRRVNIGLAVDSEQGLRVPVVRDVDQKGLAEIARETAALVEAARKGRLSPEAMQGGSFTITNLGMFGIDAFTPILNLSECAVLGVGRIRPQPAVVEDQVVVRQKLWLSLTFDHRLIDGGPAARFLQRVAQLIEAPPAVEP